MKDFSLFIDTNIFLRVCMQDSPAQTRACQEVIQAIQAGRLTAVTSELVIAEFVWTAISFYKLPKAQVTQLVKALLALPNLSIQGQPNMLLALELYQTYKVKFIDAVIASYELVQIGELPVLSYDKDFDLLGVKRYKPSDLPIH